MKAIAEYFRDLAQDDRYFGAEPPTPDAEMLARIAEREIERRVEARFEQGNLVLRPTDEDKSPRGDVATDTSTGAALVGAAAGAAATGLVAANTLDDTSEAAEDDVSLDVALDDDTDVDADAISALMLEDEAPQEISLSTDDAVADLDGSDELLIESVEVEEPEAEAAQAPDAGDDSQSIEDFIAAQSNPDDMPAEVAAEIDTPDVEVMEDVDAAQPVTDSVAEKLQRIRAVVASKPAAEPDYIEDEHAMSGPDGDGVDENDAIDVVAGLAALDDAHADTAEPAPQEAPVAEAALDDADDNLFTDTIAALVNDEIDSDDEDEAILPDVPYEDDATAEVDAPETLDEIAALRAKIAELEAQAAAAQDAGDDAEDTPVVSDGPLVLAAEDAVPVEDSAEDDAVEAPRPIVARVNKAKRSDVEAALAAGALEEYDDEDDVEDTSEAPDATPVPGADDSSLTAEQEAELARELAELQAEIEDDDDWDFDVADDSAELSEESEDDDTPALSADAEAEAEANIRKAVKLTSPARAMLTDSPIEEDASSVDRLIDQTETEMDEPEGNRRRSAIAHLRAAVAATKADRLLGLGKKTDDQEEPYREDLADAVRPRRPVVTQSRSERPAPVRPAPLKLVAEQRVDAEEDAAATTPIRPRRVMRSADVADASETLDGADGEGFAEFAENAGANTLPELLEAAAAYMSFVEGRDQFSRPQLMTKLHQAEGDASSREERLRSFGQLLREGKIEKKGGGRFTASDSIGFKPSARAAG
ncbi:hypothetical protein MWU54_03200 [Marivita sp. S6314]|uniref:hypothetical protein n=1 Tax=Marivita sp. S6314 TaxID=2926406 RepID=UPI001FF1A896|nr:hypothetical protein [Marivita sp. S6314]MCK0149018.1 hypothetical protein [Marivita sp. S6314]